ncbi:hypothetical protein [Streptomyces sp. TRM49041]|uniref:hypothetical protein n=1 Tax=Streptomyces sp. TRM49041 TaxID=2603216 RepID=UPI0011ED1FF7|nr:hypothetical protein [Streptomyces sp. TRM49041]
MANASKNQNGLPNCPAFRETPFVVIDFEGTTPKGFSPEPIEVAALGVQQEPGRGPVRSGIAFQSLIRPPARVCKSSRAREVVASKEIGSGAASRGVAEQWDAARYCPTRHRATPVQPVSGRRA